MTTHPGEATRPPAARRGRFGTAGRLARRHPLATAVVLLAAAMAALRLGWGWHTGGQRVALEAAARARGEPLTPADLAAAPVPAEEDAWPSIAAAAKANDRSAPSFNTANLNPGYPPFGPFWERAAVTSEANNAAVFVAARQVRKLDRAGFPSPTAVGVGGTRWFSYAGEVNEVAMTVGDGAVLSHLKGDHAEAVERLRDALHLAALLRDDPWTSSQWQAMWTESATAHQALMLAPGLRLGEPAARAAAVGLVGDLLDERRPVAGFRMGLAGARVNDRLVQFFTGQSPQVHAMEPVLARQEARDLERSAAYVAAGATADNAENFARALAAAGFDPPAIGRRDLSFRPSPTAPPRYSRWFADRGEPHDRYVQMHFGLLADRRAAAVSLATQLFRADHGGRWPATLAELVPTYLPHVPVNPHLAGGAPLGYEVRRGTLPGGGDRPLVWFDVRPPAAADPPAASALPPGAEPNYDWLYSNDEGNRQFRDLSRWSPAVRPVDGEIEAQLRFEEQQARELAEGQRAAAAEAAATQPAGTQPSR